MHVINIYCLLVPLVFTQVSRMLSLTAIYYIEEQFNCEISGISFHAIGANHKTDGVDGGGITKENICQCAHVSHKQYKCQQ